MTFSRNPVYEKEIMDHIAKMTRILEKFRVKSQFETEDYLAIERALQVLIESLIGLARYFVRVTEKTSISKSGEAIDELLRLNAITPAGHAACRKMIGYRNVLVHDYLNANPAITADIVRTGQFHTVVELANTLLQRL